MFKLYPNKSSVLKNDNRYVSGGYAEIETLKVKWWERKIFPKEDFSDRRFVITKDFEFRPDLISNEFFGRPDLGWLILQYNNIVDIMEELAVGKEIIVPDRARTLRTLLTKQRPANAAITADSSPTRISR
jgi:hypothetical protein